jgi:ketosteroid isomerase-like protein
MTFFSCKVISVRQSPATSQEILKADRDFSALSAEQGMKKAFLSFAHDSVVMLRDNGMPIVGKGALESHYQNFTDSTFTLIWEPLFADIAFSGELGYSYGIFTLTPKDESQKPEQGTYCTVWKKDANGNWKFVLDTGNDGLAK